MTEFAFVLPVGYLDGNGTLHRQGAMRLATAADEIKPWGDQRVQSNESYYPVLVLARVITHLGELGDIDNGVIEAMYSKDFLFLQEMFNQINKNYGNSARRHCRHCHHQFDLFANCRRDETIASEFEFTLPIGYTDNEGQCHQKGRMRLETVADTIKITADPRVRQNQMYYNIIVLTRCILQLGNLRQVTNHVIENLSSQDFHYLLDFHHQINEALRDRVELTCPQCDGHFEAEVAMSGESSATSLTTSTRR